jgi:hypothetical protein
MDKILSKKATDQKSADSRYRIIETYDGHVLRVDVELAREAMREAMTSRAIERELHTNDQPQPTEP